MESSGIEAFQQKKGFSSLDISITENVREQTFAALNQPNAIRLRSGIDLEFK